MIETMNGAKIILGKILQSTEFARNIKWILENILEVIIIKQFKLLN